MFAHQRPQILKKKGSISKLFLPMVWVSHKSKGVAPPLPVLWRSHHRHARGAISILLRNGTPFFCFPEEKREGEARLRPVTCAGSGGFHFGRRNVAPEETVVVVVVPFIAFRVGLIAPTPSSARCVIVVACLRPSSPRPSACIGSPEPVGRRCYKYVTRSRR